MIKPTRFSKYGQYVVFGKNIPHSVGFNLKSSAIKYADYFKEKGLKPRITYLLKPKTIVKDLNSKPSFYKFEKKN